MTLFITITTVILVMCLTGMVMRSALDLAEKEYFNSCDQVLDGYVKAFDYYFVSYQRNLNHILEKKPSDEIDYESLHEWLDSGWVFSHKDFRSLFFVDAEKKPHFLQGMGPIFPPNQPVPEEVFQPAELYVSNLITSPRDGSNVFIISKSIFSEDGTFKGALCASVPVSTLERFCERIKISDSSYLCLNDRLGTYMVHPDKTKVGETFPVGTEKNILAPATEKNEKNFYSGMFEAENEKGESAYVFYRTIKNCGWRLLLISPKAFIQRVYSNQATTKFMIFSAAMVVILVLFFLEKKILDSFYRNQLVDVPFDSLTRLLTRQHFENEASRILKHNPDKIYMLVTADIRGFKFINQNYGEEAADKLILFFSKKLNKFVNRRSGIVGRGYADRFDALFKVSGVRPAMAAFKQEMEALNEEIKDYEIPFFPKYGITFFRGEKKRELTIRELVGQATFAKSMIKNNSLVPFAVYEPRFLAHINEERFMEVNMERALNEGEFVVCYQPKVSLDNDKVVGAEALVRWKSKEYGFIMPNDFIPLFEKNGFIKKIDFYVYEQVFKFIRKQLDEGKPVVPVSVNMSRNHNKPDKFMHEFMKIFSKYDIPPSLVQVEIIERSFMDVQTLCDITNLLHKEGFSVAMDDFGSGESSLNMLVKIPVDVLKFDQEFLLSFVNEKGSKDKKTAKVLKLLIELSKQLEKLTVFEGVETLEQRDFLKSLECDQVQGYFYSRPLFEEDFVNFLARNI